MKTLALEMVSIGPTTFEVKPKVVDIPLLSLLEEKLPWFMPSKTSGSTAAGFTWMAASPMPFWRQYLGEPPYEGAVNVWKRIDKEGVATTTTVPGAPPASKSDVPGLYDLGVIPPSWNADTFMSKILGGFKVIAFDDSALPGSVLAELEDWAMAQRISLDAAMDSGKVSIFPYATITQKLTRKVFGHHLVDFGWRDRASRLVNGVMHQPDFPKYFEIRYWYTPKIIEGLDSHEGRMVIEMIEGKTRKICKVHVSTGRLPQAILEWSKGAPPEIALWDEIEPNTKNPEEFVAFAFPVEEDATFRRMETVLSNLDELFVPRTHCFGEITISELRSFVQRRLGVKTVNSQEVAQELGKYYRTIETALVDALEPPRTVVAGQSGQAAALERTAKRPEVAYLPAVQQAVTQVWEDGDFTSIWLANLLCRTAVVLHTRHSTIFDAGYKTPMFEPETLIHAIIRSREHDMATYLSPALLVAPISKKRGERVLKAPVRPKATSPMLGENFDDLFG